jgi:hypothetical protein
MNHQQRRTLQQTVTTLSPAEVLAAAKRYFATRHGIYAAFLEKEGPTYVNLRGQGGEEVVIGVAESERGTAVTGSSYLFDQQIARFLATLPAAPDVGPEDVAPSLDEAMSGDDAPPGGVQPTGLATAGGTGNPPGRAGGSPA